MRMRPNDDFYPNLRKRMQTCTLDMIIKMLIYYYVNIENMNPLRVYYGFTTGLLRVSKRTRNIQKNDKNYISTH